MGLAELGEFKKVNLPKPGDGQDRHMAMLEAIAPFARSVSKNLTEVKIIPSTKKSKAIFVLLPEWSPMMAPFNIARLSSVVLKAGYQTKCYDINAKLYIQHPKWIEDGKIDYNPWDGARSFKWDQHYYFEELHNLALPTLEYYLDEIEREKPDFVGLTMYYCNESPVIWFAQELKKRLPNVKLGLGGPGMHLRFHQVQHEPPYFENGRHLFDYAVTGEGEQLILQILAEIEQGYKKEGIQMLSQQGKERLNLNNFPIPDYKDFDFNDYEISNGMLTEFSRGCVAKCTFCEETHFWNYRQRQAISAIEEIEHMYYTYGTNVIWFLDSLVNGNLSELRAFCKAVVAKQMEIKWTGYSRCDGRMDDEYFKDLAASGCFMLNYGCESGSDKVLADMVKGVTKKEMEQNFKSNKKYKIEAMTNWIVGFPTEQYQDFSDTMTMLWRNRLNNITVISTAPGFGLGMQTINGQNPDRFGIENFWFCGGILRKDRTLSKFHTLIRVKSFAIFCMEMVKHVPHPVAIPNRPNLIGKHYVLEFLDKDQCFDIEYENFDYNILKPNISSFADSLVNEMFVLFRLIWRMKGAFKMTYKFNPIIDKEEFGTIHSEPFYADVEFNIDKEGNWNSKGTYKFEQPESYTEDRANLYPFKHFDFSKLDSDAAKRARKLAKSEFGMEGRPAESFVELEEHVMKLNREENLSFEYAYETSGKW